MIYLRTKTYRAFTLVETLVAIAIFSASIATLVAVSGSALSDASYAKNRLTANYLAQEGIELVRMLRDSANLQSPPNQSGWSIFTDTQNPSALYTCAAASGCNISPLKWTPLTKAEPCDAQNEYCQLHIDPQTGYYGDYTVDVGNPSLFRREIHVDTYNVQDSANEVRVTVTVEWHQGSGTQSVVLTEYLANYPLNF